MTYIRCPECGARTLHVATTCPQCHHVLTQNPMQLGADSGLVVCRTCGKHTPGDASSCQFCGGAMGGRRTGTIAVIVVALIVVGIGGWWLVTQRPFRPAPPPPAVAAPPATPPREEPAEPEGPGLLATPIAPAIVAQTAPAVETVTRWTEEWLNLRDGPGLGTQIIRPVPSGTRLEVANPVRAWWTVYEDGVAVGFISGTELSRTPPADTLP